MIILVSLIYVIINILNFMLFTFFIGKISPVIFENEKSLNEDYLEVNSRDFLASLQRMLLLKIDHSNPKLTFNSKLNIIDELDFSKIKNELITTHVSYFQAYKEPIFTLSSLDENGRKFISEELIRGLGKCLKDRNNSVKDAAVGALGQIGVPEALLVLDDIITNIDDEDINLKAKAVWTIGRLAPGCDTNVRIN